MTVLARLLPDNPVLTKELRVRMRGARAYWILLGYLGFIAALLLLQYYSFVTRISTSGAGGSNSATLGFELFEWIMVPQVFLVLFITPAITSGTITIEREQQTMEMLTLTRLSRRSIVTGKLISAVSFSALLIISSLPLISICFMLGGIDPALVFSAYMELLTASVLIGAMGMMWSSVAKTTTQAVIMTYVTLFLVFVFGAFVFGVHLAPVGGTAAATTIRIIGSEWFGRQFLGFTAPEGMGFAAFCLLAGALMTAVATVRIEMFPYRKAYVLRGLMLLLFAFQFLAFDMCWVNGWYRRAAAVVAVAVPPPIGVLMLSAMGLLLITPIFATGEIASFEARRIFKYILWGFTPAGLKRGKLASGIPFLVIAAFVCLGAYALSFTLAGHRSAVTSSGALALGLPGVPPPAAVQLKGKEGEQVTVTGLSVTVVQPTGASITATKLPNGTVQVIKYGVGGASSIQVVANWPASVPALPPPAPPVKVDVPQTGDFVQGAIVLVVTVIGFGLFCMLLSVMFRSRWLAVILAYVLLLLVFILPEIATGLGSEAGTVALSGINLFYLNPVQAFLQMCEPATYWESRPLLFGHQPMWLSVSYTWAAIGGLSLLAMIPCLMRIAKENEPIPYEEQVQLA